MAKVYLDNAVELALIQKKKVAIIGYGSQGHAHALNLKDSGIDVRVGRPKESRSRAKAEQAGLTVLSVSEVFSGGQLEIVQVSRAEIGWRMA